MDIFHDYSVDLDLCSSGLKTIPANSQLAIDYIVERFGYLTGLEYFRYGGNANDTASFQVIVNGAVALELATDVLLGQGHLRYEAYKAIINQGMTLRLLYKNNGTQAVQFGYNVIRHKVK